MTRSATRAMLAFGLLIGCGSAASLDQTIATAEIVRGGAQIGDADLERIGRAAKEQEIAVGDRGLLRLSLDSGPQLLLDAATHVAIADETTLRLSAGRMFAQAASGEELWIEGEHGKLRASDASLSVEARNGTLSAYVVRGEVSWQAGRQRGIAQAGERLTLARNGARTEAAMLWEDWTGGLARPGPGDAERPSGVGVLEARVPDEIGQARWPLVIRRLDVRVHIVEDLAVTEVEQVFFNPASETVEGLYRIRVPEDAVLQRFAVDRNGSLVDGYVREEEQARQAYEEQVYRGSTLDPALLEWVAPGSYSARIYPINPGESRRIVVRYAEWLSGIGESGPRFYRYPMGAGGNAPRIQELSITVDLDEAGAERVRAGMGAAIEEGRVRLRRSDFAPRSDFWLELIGGERQQRAWRAPHEPPPRAPQTSAPPNEADERDYWYLPLRLPEAWAERERAAGIDLVIVADVSAATDRSHLELGRSVVESITAHLGERDRVAIVSSDLTIRPLTGRNAQLGNTSAQRIETLLDALARVRAGGATDLGEALGAAAALLDPHRPGAIVYVGDGAPTVGELEADGLLDRMARIPSPPRLYAIGIGGDANIDLLEALTRGGGLALRVEERSAAADAALRVLAHAVRPVAQRVRIDLGTGIENVYPRREVDAVIGDVLPVVGRVREEPPHEVTVHATIAGRELTETIPIETQTTEETTDLRLRWAGERLRQLLLEGASREEVAELGVRYGLITPFTSYYVPSAQELAQMGPSAERWIDRPNLLAELDHDRVDVGEALLTVALGPLAIAGCSSSDEVEPLGAPEPSSVAPTAPTPPPEVAARDEGGAMGEAPTNGASNRYAITGATTQPAEPQPSPATVEAPPPPPTASPVTTAEQAPAPDMAQAVPAQQGYFGNDRGGGGGAAPSAGAAPARVQVQTRPTATIPVMPPTVAHAPAHHRAGASADGSDMDDLLDQALASGEATGSARGARRRAVPDEAARTHEGRDAVHAGLFEDGEGADANGEDQRIIVRQIIVAPPTHARTSCSDAASLPLDDRSSLWNERLSQGAGPSGWVEVYRRAIRDCEAPSWRDRRTLLGLILNQAGSISTMLDVYRILDSGAARGFLRAAILRRVRSPDDLRAVRGAFGLGQDPDWELVEQILARANGPEGRLRALRHLTLQYPDSFELALRLLEMLETNGHAPEARRLAERLRADPRSDAGVRTAVGEMYLRMGNVDEARRVFSEIVEFAPLDELARRRLGDLYRAHGWFDDAYRQYQTLASIRPDDPSVLLLLAQAAAGAGRVDEALRLEQRLMETAQPGATRGIARIAQLWSSVHFAKLRSAASQAHDGARLAALAERMRQSGVLTGSSELRVTLSWSHPDAQVSLWGAHPDSSLSRPAEIAPENGIEAFDLPEQENGTYRFEVRRSDPDSPTTVNAELVLVWHEGQDDEVVRVIPLRFDHHRALYAWSLRGNQLRDAAP